MAISKTILASASFITTPSTASRLFTPAGIPEVFGNQFMNVMTSAAVTASTESLVTPNQMRNPGVFTQGTAPEGTASNPTNDSKS